MSIPFTQFLRPNGRQTSVSIERPAAVEAKARQFMDAGGWFECEELTTGHASLTAVWRIEEGRPDDIAIKVVPNGPAVPAAVDHLVDEALAWLTSHQADAQTAT